MQELQCIYTNELDQAAYISQGDRNADGRLSFDEFLAIRNAGFDAKQIPVSWREARQSRR